MVDSPHNALMAAIVCLILHIGSPLAVFYLLLSPNPSSPLWWLAMFYGAYLLVLIAAFWRIHTFGTSKVLGIITLAIAIGTSTTLGWLLGMFAGRLEFVLSSVIRPLGQMAEGRPEFVDYRDAGRAGG
jgi:hypothetical protein